MKHRPAGYKSLVCVIIIGMACAGCGMQNKFASSFGKRRYTKGFYVDVPGPVQTVNGKAIHKRAAKVFVEIPVHNADISCTSGTPDIKPAKSVIHKPEQVSRIAVNHEPTPGVVPKEASIETHRDVKQNSSGIDGSFAFISLGVLTLDVIIFLIILLTADFISDAGVSILLILTCGLYLSSFIMAIVALVRHEPHSGVAILVIALDAFIAGMIFAFASVQGP